MMAADDLIVGELREWRKHVCKSDGTFVIWGFIYGDVRFRFPDGHWIHTSKVDRIEDDLVHTQSGSVYRLVGEASAPELNMWAEC